MIYNQQIRLNYIGMIIQKEIHKDDLFEAEEKFLDYIDLEFDTLKSDDFDNIIQLQNFKPEFFDKDVTAPRWIKVPTENGFKVYYAKGSNKYLNAEAAKRKLDKIIYKDAKSIKSLNTKIRLMEEIEIANLVSALKIDLKFVRIQKSKTTFEYLLPYQYEVVDDESIMNYMDALSDPMNKESVKYTAFFDQDDEDKIFYMTTRGIPRSIAIMMAKLESCIFEINLKAALCEVYQPHKIEIKKG